MLGRSLMVILGIVVLFVPASSEKVEIGIYEVRENSTFSVPVIAKNLTNIAGFDISLQYDPDVIQFVSYSVGSEMGQNFHFDNVDKANGSARFIIVANKAINSDNLTVVVLNFRATGTPGSQSELRLYAELSRVIEEEQTNFQTIIPVCVGGRVYIKPQLQTEPSKTPTPTHSSISGGGGYTEITTPSPTATTSPTPTPVKTSTPETVNVSMNESWGQRHDQNSNESTMSDSSEKSHSETEKPTIVPTAKINNGGYGTGVQNDNSGTIKSTPPSEKSTETQKNSAWSIPGFDSVLTAVVLIFVAGRTFRAK